MAKKIKPKQYLHRILRSEIKSIVGIDNSLTSLGIAKAILGKNTVKSISYSTIGTSHDLEIHPTERYMAVSGEIVRKWVDESSLVLMENYAFGMPSGQHRLVSLAGQGELVRAKVFAKTNRHVVMVSPSQIKKFMSGKGNLPKNDVKLVAYKKYQIEFKTTDEAEAYTLVKIGALLLGYGKENLTYERVVADSILENLEID